MTTITDLKEMKSFFITGAVALMVPDILMLGAAYCFHMANIVENNPLAPRMWEYASIFVAIISTMVVFMYLGSLWVNTLIERGEYE